jgi:hypothetical protein
MAKVKQLTVPCKNRPGELARVAKVLGEAKVNIMSCLTTTSGDEGAMHLVVDNINKAKKALDAADLSYTEVDALQVELANAPGALGKFAGKLADQGINVTLGYQTSVKGSRKASVVLMVSDLDKAARIR